jgi:hypothetical protein
MKQKKDAIFCNIHPGENTHIFQQFDYKKHFFVLESDIRALQL